MILLNLRQIMSPLYLKPSSRFLSNSEKKAVITISHQLPHDTWPLLSLWNPFQYPLSLSTHHSSSAIYDDLLFLEHTKYTHTYLRNFLLAVPASSNVFFLKAPLLIPYFLQLSPSQRCLYGYHFPSQTY